MYSVHPIIEFFLCIILSTLISKIKATDVTFEELGEQSMACINENSCYGNGSRLLKRGASCHCDSSCSQLGTCCFDSPYRELNGVTEIPTCKSVPGNSQRFFIIDKCPLNGSQNVAFRSQCEDDQNTEDGLVSLVPVTSLYTTLTYKNYFCFRCHETNNDYLFWKVKLSTNTPLNSNQVKKVIPVYSKASETWQASVGRNDKLFPVAIAVHVPEEIIASVSFCDPHIISTCSEDWPEDEIKRKCGLYMSLIMIRGNFPYTIYKNPHCSLCHYKKLEEKFEDCLAFSSFIVYFDKENLFSFTYLLDVKPSDEYKMGKKMLCDESFSWDPFFKKYRKLGCVLPGYIIKDGKCNKSP